MFPEAVTGLLSEPRHALQNRQKWSTRYPDAGDLRPSLHRRINSMGNTLSPAGGARDDAMRGNRWRGGARTHVSRDSFDWDEKVEGRGGQLSRFSSRRARLPVRPRRK